MKLVNINGIYINPDTVVCIQNVDNQYQGQYVAIITTAGAEMSSAEYSEAHQIHIQGVDIKDIAEALNSGKGTASKAKPKSGNISPKQVKDLF